MAKGTAFQPVEIPRPSIWFGDLGEASASRILIVQPGRTAEYLGSFTYGLFGEVFGTVTQLSETLGGLPFYTISGLSVDANALFNAVQIQADPQATAALILSGDDELVGSSGNDTASGLAGDDLIFGMEGDDILGGGPGDDTLDGGPGTDMAVFDFALAGATFLRDGPALLVTETASGDTDRLIGIETLAFTDTTIAEADAGTIPVLPGITFAGTAADEVINGTPGDDSLSGGGGNDTINADDGSDTVIGGDGDDLIFGGASAADLRDNIFGGAGNDTIDGGHGNDELRGDAGNDVLRGGFGVDSLFGGAGDDNINGGAFSDLVFGGDGADFVNGGFGFDRINGGGGADMFFHLGIADHGSDWIQDFAHAEGDVLLFGQAGATGADFQVNIATTEGAGAADVAEAFVVYKPTGQIIWALVDGAANSSLNLSVTGSDAVFDLLA